MSGHSKWANIKRKKGANDAIRGKITTKIGREITIAVRMGGADPTGNMRLKLALTKAKANNIPKDNIKRAIDKGMGASGDSNYEEMTYEGYGPGGSALIVNVLTDNKNRTAADVRHIFSKYGGSLGATGCVGWMFKKKAVFVVEKETFDDILQALGDKGIETASAEITMVPDNTVKVEGANATNMQKMLDAFDDNDDVQDVYGNYEMDEEE